MSGGQCLSSVPPAWAWHVGRGVAGATLLGSLQKSPGVALTQRGSGVCLPPVSRRACAVPIIRAQDLSRSSSAGHRALSERCGGTVTASALIHPQPLAVLPASSSISQNVCRCRTKAAGQAASRMPRGREEHGDGASRRPLSFGHISTPVRNPERKRVVCYVKVQNHCQVADKQPSNYVLPEWFVLTPPSGVLYRMVRYNILCTDK